ncbi:MAG: LysM peptidoglycan-binding domain-containing protein [Mycobacteriales bacterium]
MTRRGAVLLRLCFVAVAALLLAAVAVQAKAAMEAAAGQGYPSVVVAPGDTVWNIAAEHGGAGSLPAKVSRIAVLNDLDGVAIEPGQRLFLP